jgi:parvulin-like peptidyl-prolyl isomerase
MPPTLPPPVPADKVVIAVGDQKITAGQFDQIVAGLGPQYQNSVRGAGRRQFADRLAQVLILAQEAKRRKLDESPSYQTQILFQNANVLAALAYDQLGKDAKIDDADVRKYYDEHKKDFEQVRARHILIRMQGSPLPVKPGQKDLTEAEALAKAQDVRKRIVEGHEEFEAVARVESDDNGSGANGGDLGFFHHNQMVPPFEEAAFAMKAGEISQPVKTQFGYHVIKLEAVKTYDELKPEVEKRMRPEMAQKALTELEKKTGVTLDSDYFPAPPAPPAAAPSAPPAAK